MQQFERFFDGQPRLRASLAPAVHPLKDRRFGPVDGPCSGCIDPGLAAMRGKLPQHGRQLVGKRLQAQVGVPQAQIKRVGHLY
jgi:hypothetical protein